MPCYPPDPETCDKCGSKLEVKNRKAVDPHRRFRCPVVDCKKREEEYLPLEHWYPIEEWELHNGYLGGVLES